MNFTCAADMPVTVLLMAQRDPVGDDRSHSDRILSILSLMDAAEGATGTSQPMFLYSSPRALREVCRRCAKIVTVYRMHDSDKPGAKTAMQSLLLPFTD